MKIIALIGSPHGKKGNTARLMNIVLAGAHSLGAETTTIILPGNTVLPCLGCGICHKKGSCIQKDDFEAIKEKIHQADGVVLGSPNYIFTVSAQLKAFMDRCCNVVHCLGFEGKYGASVVTSGGGDEQPIADFMNFFLTITGIRPVGSVWATMGLISGDTFPDDITQKATALGKTLVQSWKEKKVLPDVENEMNRFKERMRQLMLYRKEQFTWEYQYWQEHRGLI